MAYIIKKYLLRGIKDTSFSFFRIGVNRYFNIINIGDEDNEK
ncbi:hypothetical protein [Oceanirhabdus seepicola]|nr:hypothetical protein [Oceanirhabdus seepicola]